MKIHWLFLFVVFIAIVSCKSDPIPKPRGYFRIDFPEKEYKNFQGDCPFSFEMPVYSSIKIVKHEANECWYNVEIPDYKVKVHLTYKDLNSNISTLSEDIRSIAYKHTQMADDIVEVPILRPNDKVYGVLYKIKGNTASNMSFYLTDSSNHFLSGALYFSSRPNKDSLAPAIQFFGEDVVHLTKTVLWK